MARRGTALAAIALAAFALSGCPVAIPEGRFGCSRGEPCPPEMTCGPAGRCVRGTTVDAGPRDASTEDAGMPVDAAIDATVDAGGPCSLAAASLQLETISGTGAEDAFGVVVAADRDYRIPVSFSGTFGTIAGHTLTAVGPAVDALLLRRDPDGTLELLRWLSGANDNTAAALSADGRWLTGSTSDAMEIATTTSLDVTASSAGYLADVEAGVLYTLDSSDSTATITPRAIAVTGDQVCVGGSFRGGFDAVGATGSEASDAFITCRAVATGASGASRVISGTGDDVIRALVSDGASGLYVGGTFTGTITIGGLEHVAASADGDAFVAHLDAGLSELGFFSFGTAGNGVSTIAAIAINDGAVYAAGRIAPGSVAGLVVPPRTDPDAILLQLDRALSTTGWATTGGDDGYDELFALTLDPCGDPVVAGGFGNTSGTTLDGLVPEIRRYAASDGHLRERIAPTTGTGAFRGIVSAEQTIVAVGSFSSPLAFPGASTVTPQGNSDVMIVVLRY